MDIDNLFKTQKAESYLLTDEAVLRLLQGDPRYVEPTISSIHFLRFRLVFDVWHDTVGGTTQVFGIYEANEESNESSMIRHLIIERGAFGSFDLKNGISVTDTKIDQSLLASLEADFTEQDIPAIRDGSSFCTNTDYVEVEWVFKRTSRQAGWALPNSGMSTLHKKLRQLADTLRSLECR